MEHRHTEHTTKSHVAHNASISKSSPGRMILGGIILLLIAGGGVFWLTKSKSNKLEKQINEHEQAAKNGIVIKAVKVDDGTGVNNDLVLMGEAVPYEEATLYAKTAGYVDKVYFDKGDKVKEGQLLATVISPETDQSYRAAQADLENKKKIEVRESTLVKKDYVSAQEAEAAATDVKTAEANVNSLRAQQDYKNIRAPFTGTITARNVDPGALVQNATNSQTSALPVATIAKVDELRIYVYVEQNSAGLVKSGTPVTITMADNSDLKIEAKVARTSDALDPKTRMMLVEVDIPNTDGKIVAGSYVQVHIHKPKSEHLQIPAEALIIAGKKYEVVLVGKDSTVHYQPVTVLNNDGIHVSLLNGVEAGDIVGVNVGQSVSDGQKVRVQM